MNSEPLAERVERLVRVWGVDVESTLETPSSFVGFGLRDGRPVVLKVVRQPGDEWRCGEILHAFGGRGIVRAYEYVEGAVLLERLRPGTSLAGLSLAGRDEEATEILADVIRRLSCPAAPPDAVATARGWGEGFRRYLTSGDNQIPASLVEQAQHLYLELCASQRAVRLLHGDLQHYNVLFDAERGWLAIDPKGVVGEIEYEIGAGLRNPVERPELFASPKTILKRLRHYEARLKINPERALAWSFAQAVLSAIWSFEDGYVIGESDPFIKLANVAQLILK